MKRGFTLVELSIVLVIIGLLIGGILVGQSLIASARINKVISEVNQYQIAVRLFKEKFRGIPGDFSRADQLFGGCTQTNNSTCNGDGSGYISGGDGTLNDLGTWWEGTLAWNHMSVSQILPKMYLGQRNGARPVYTTSWPKTEYKGAAIGYYNLYSVPPNGAIDGNSAFWWYGFTRKNSIVLAAERPDGYVREGVIRPADAMAIDSKLDDGNPKSGKVWAESSTSSDGTERRCLTLHGTTTTPANTAYNIAYDDSVMGCQLLFVLEGI